MILKHHSLYLFVLYLLVFIAFESNEATEGEKISLSVPQLSEEENRSNHMPSNLKCDACLAVSYQINSVLLKEQQKIGKSKGLKESEIIDIIENACNEGFHGYGVKQVDGINRLSGPGLDTEKVIGMTQMGGRWPHRLQEMCHYYVGETGEFDIYEIFREGKNKLTDFLCYGKGIYGYCKPLNMSDKTEL